MALQLWQIANINLRHNFKMYALLGGCMVLLTPLIFGMVGLDTMACAVPLEMFVSLTGIVLLTPVFQPEQSEEIKEITESKYISSTIVYMIRIAYSMLTLVFLIALVALIMIMGDCKVTGMLVFGAIADAMFLGGLGLVFAALTNHTVVSYMIPISYYVANYSGGNKLGNFYLFSMMAGEYTPKIWMFGSSILFIAAAILIKRKK